MKDDFDNFTVLSEEDLPRILRRVPTRITLNPLRVGEPARMSGIQTHISGEQPDKSSNELSDYIRSKEIQNIAICLEDINHLVAMIKILPQASDYTNKLIGKYIILEIFNIFSCFTNLAKVSQDFKALSQKLQKELKKLDKKYNFKDIRHKIVAHKHHDRHSTINLSPTEQLQFWNLITSDSLSTYIELLDRYVPELNTLAPLEYLLLLQTNGKVIDATELYPPVCGDEYDPFYEETRNWEPDHFINKQAKRK